MPLLTIIPVVTGTFAGNPRYLFSLMENKSIKEITWSGSSWSKAEQLLISTSVPESRFGKESTHMSEAIELTLQERSKRERWGRDRKCLPASFIILFMFSYRGRWPVRNTD